MSNGATKRKWEVTKGEPGQSVAGKIHDTDFGGLQAHIETILDCKCDTLITGAFSICWGHVQQGLENPMDDLFVCITLEGVKRTVGKPPSNQKDPLTTEMAKGIVDTLGPNQDLIKWRTIVLCLLGFSGFLRISELLAVQVKHLTFTKEHLERVIPKAKNGQMREVYIVYPEAAAQ